MLLGILIFVHELGHFIFAKLMGVRVLKFSLGFGPKLIGKKHGDTEYLISAFPLGGYVKMLGEDPETELSEDEKAMAFNYQPVWKRFGIVFFGPLFNLLFACLLFILIYMGGVPALYPDVGEIIANSPASGAGILKGDRIVEIDGKSIGQWEEMTGIIHNSPGRSLDFRIKRGDEVFPITIVPETKTITNIFGEEKKAGLIGIRPLGNQFKRHYGAGEAVIMGTVKTVEISVLTVESIIKLIQRIIPAETIGGPILIVQMAGEQASQGALNFFFFMGVISINLGILNLLPIPVLDGGHLVFFAVEAVRGRQVSQRVVINAQRVGIAVLIAIMAFALYNDLMRIFTGKGFNP